VEEASMPSEVEADGKNSLMGEFLLSLARAPEPVQEAIILFGLKAMRPYANSLIYPYPMLSHMLTIMEPNKKGTQTIRDPLDDE
jgi:hypothetical protein